MTEDLRVDTSLVRESGGKLQTIAGLIPEPPATFSPPGGDALSTAIAGKVAEVVDPVVAQMPITKDALTAVCAERVERRGQVRQHRPADRRGDPQAFGPVRRRRGCGQ